MFVNSFILQFQNFNFFKYIIFYEYWQASHKVHIYMIYSTWGWLVPHLFWVLHCSYDKLIKWPFLNVLIGMATWRYLSINDLSIQCRWSIGHHVVLRVSQTFSITTCRRCKSAVVGRPSGGQIIYSALEPHSLLCLLYLCLSHRIKILASRNNCSSFVKE